MMVTAKHLRFQVVTNLVNKVNFKEGFTTYKVPHYAFLSELLFMVQNIINSLLCYFSCHLLLGVLAHEIAVFAGELAVFSDDESDRLGNVFLPLPSLLFYIKHNSK